MTTDPAATKSPYLSAVVPCYNEQNVLGELRHRLVRVCEDAVGNDFEIVFVDDGSKDDTREILRRFHEEDPRIGCVLLARNHGHQLALTAGLHFARGKRIFILDADLQDPPELLHAMLTRMDEGFDVVYGRRRTRSGESAFKIKTAHYFYRLLSRVADTEIPRDSGDFRLMSRRVADVLESMPERHRFIRGMVSWVGFAQTAIPYDRDPRFAGETKYPLRRMIILAFDAITSFSVLPLRLATFLGFGAAFIAAIVSIYVLIAWLSGMTVSGWTSLTLLIMFIGGAQLVMIGILGEYVGRLFMQAKARPLFVVEEFIRTEAVLRPQPKVNQIG